MSPGAGRGRLKSAARTPDGEGVSAPAAPSRCPCCQARLPPGTSWCLQCYEPVLIERPTERPAALLPAAVPVVVARSEPDEVERAAAQLLLALAESETSRPLALPGPLARLAPLTATRAGRAALTSGLTLVVSLLVYAMMAALGALLG